MWMDPLRSAAQQLTPEQQLFADVLLEWGSAAAAVRASLDGLRQSGEAAMVSAAQAQGEPAAGQASPAFTALLRSLHSQKSLLRMIELSAAADIVHALEDLLGASRRAVPQAPVDPACLALVESAQSLLGRSLRGLAAGDSRAAAALEPARRALLRAVDGGARTEALEVARLVLDPWSEAPQQLAREAELAGFRKLGAAAEARIGEPPERALQREQWACAAYLANGGGRHRIPLAAAALLWNLGRARLPEELRRLRQPPVDAGARQQWLAHPQLASDFLAAQPEWAEAAIILARRDGAQARSQMPELPQLLALLQAVDAWLECGTDPQATHASLAALETDARAWLKVLGALPRTGH